MKHKYKSMEVPNKYCYTNVYRMFQVGDHIEKLNNINVVGKRHYEVARLLKDIPTGSTFTLRLIEPMKSGFQGIGPRSGSKSSKKGYGSGKETLRFKANGDAAIEDKVSSPHSWRYKVHQMFQKFPNIYSYINVCSLYGYKISVY